MSAMRYVVDCNRGSIVVPDRAALWPVPCAVASHSSVRPPPGHLGAGFPSFHGVEKKAARRWSARRALSVKASRDRSRGVSCSSGSPPSELRLLLGVRRCRVRTGAVRSRRSRRGAGDSSTGPRERHPMPPGVGARFPNLQAAADALVIRQTRDGQARIQAPFPPSGDAVRSLRTVPNSRVGPPLTPTSTTSVPFDSSGRRAAAVG